MKFIKKIREDLGYTHYKMAQLMGVKGVFQYTRFEESTTSVNIKRLVELWRLSNLSGNEFMSLIAKELEEEES
jgi:hypothetical protein